MEKKTNDEADEMDEEEYIVKTHLACLPFVKPVIEQLLYTPNSKV
jgi:hypothetical protein